MSGGFLALLDDVGSTLSGVATASASNITSATKASLKHFDDVAGMVRIGSSKSSAIVVDDIPVNAQAVAETRIAPERELAVVGRIMKGSFLNKLALIPVALGVSAATPFAPWLLPGILAVGGAYLAYEGTEKTLETFFPHMKHKHAHTLQAKTPQELEKKLVSSALRTDVVMSAEIMFIALGAMTGVGGLVPTAIALAAVGAATTAGIYGLVGGLVKVDDIGARAQQMEGESLFARAGRAVGPLMVKALPMAMKGLSYLGTGAMLYIGGALMGHAIPAAEHLFHAAGNIGAHLPSFLSPLSFVAGWAAKSCAEQAVGLIGGLAVISGLKISEPVIGPLKNLAAKILAKSQDNAPEIRDDGPAPAQKPLLLPALAAPAPDTVSPSQIRCDARPSHDFPAAVAAAPISNDNVPKAPVPAPGTCRPGAP